MCYKNIFKILNRINENYIEYIFSGKTPPPSSTLSKEELSNLATEISKKNQLIDSDNDLKKLESIVKENAKNTFKEKYKNIESLDTKKLLDVFEKSWKINISDSEKLFNEISKKVRKKKDFSTATIDDLIGDFLEKIIKSQDAITHVFILNDFMVPYKYYSAILDNLTKSEYKNLHKSKKYIADKYEIDKISNHKEIIQIDNQNIEFCYNNIKEAIISSKGHKNELFYELMEYRHTTTDRKKALKALKKFVHQKKFTKVFDIMTSKEIDFEDAKQEAPTTEGVPILSAMATIKFPRREYLAGMFDTSTGIGFNASKDKWIQNKKSEEIILENKFWRLHQKYYIFLYYLFLKNILKEKNLSRKFTSPLSILFKTEEKIYVDIVNILKENKMWTDIEWINHCKFLLFKLIDIRRINLIKKHLL